MILATNSAPSKKKNDARPTKATAKLNAACISFRNVAAASAAASVKIAIITNAALFILRAEILGSEIVGQAHRLPDARIRQAERLPYNGKNNPCFRSFGESINARREFSSRIEHDR